MRQKSQSELHANTPAVKSTDTAATNLHLSSPQCLAMFFLDELEELDEEWQQGTCEAGGGHEKKSF